ncbi:MAG: minor capsid protein [Alphaproteobacteria bacterium]|nr:minor capsid protein [Alphaproteobacteria bacterium]
MKKQKATPSKIKELLSEILEETVKEFKVTKEEILDHKNQEDSVRQARLAAVFAAITLNFLKEDIAKAYNYPSGKAVTNDYEKAKELSKEIIEFDGVAWAIYAKFHEQAEEVLNKFNRLYTRAPDETPENEIPTPSV